MSKIRESKDSDQEEVEKAFQILRKAMKDHSEIESTLWAGALFSCLVTGYPNSGITYKEFCGEIDSVKKFYKSRWKKGNE